MCAVEVCMAHSCTVPKEKVRELVERCVPAVPQWYQKLGPLDMNLLNSFELAAAVEHIHVCSSGVLRVVTTLCQLTLALPCHAASVTADQQERRSGMRPGATTCNRPLYQVHHGKLLTWHSAWMHTPNQAINLFAKTALRTCRRGSCTPLLLAGARGSARVSLAL